MNSTGKIITVERPHAPTKVFTQVADRHRKFWNLETLAAGGPRPAGSFDAREVVDFLRDVVEDR